MHQYVEVALNLPRFQPLTYRAEASLAERLVPGMRVLVPLGSRRVTGYVISSPTSTPPAGAGGIADTGNIADAGGIVYRDVIEALEDEPLLTAELIELTRWVAGYYCCGWGETLRAALPGIREKKGIEKYRLTDAGRREADREASRVARKTGPGLPGLEAASPRLPLRLRLLGALRGGPRRAGALAAAHGRGARRELERLAGAGLAERFTGEVGGPRRARFVRLLRRPDAEERAALRKKAPRQAAALEALAGHPEGRALLRDLERDAPGTRAACAALAKKGWIGVEEDVWEGAPAAEGSAGGPPPPSPPPPHELSPPQRRAFEAVRADIEAEKFSVTLLHGVTGSGKTEVYLRLVEEAVRRGRTALVLVPEIGLTPQLLGRFRARFGERAVCLHSALPESGRARAWRRIRRGEAKVVVGTRSAVFAPLARLGLIAVDEEHDGSYKQEEAPRYNGRDTAIVRARGARAPVVLGSATPSLESYHRAKEEKYRLVELPARPGGRPLPRVQVVDLRRLPVSDPKVPPLLGPALAGAIGERLSRGEQTLLFLNRRGFSSVILCRDCGAAVECAHCSSPLTFHMAGRRLQCHLCDFTAPLPGRCPGCGSDRVGFFGLGTERVEEAARARFPGARISRLDRDTARRAGAYDRILGGMRRGEIDILIGTQMVAKGHDFSRLTLVGVVAADVGLHLPDFRAAERTFQLLTQVAGRAGRADLPGEVIVQTFRPEHYAVRCAEAHDYPSFYGREAAAREAAGYPPFRRLARLRFESKGAGAAAEAGRWAREFLEKRGARRAVFGGKAAGAIEFLGPAPAPLRRVRGMYRHHMLLKAASAARLNAEVEAALAAFAAEPALRAVRLIADIDPLSLL